MPPTMTSMDPRMSYEDNDMHGTTPVTIYDAYGSSVVMRRARHDGMRACPTCAQTDELLELCAVTVAKMTAIDPHVSLR